MSGWQSGDKVAPGEELARRPLARIGMRIGDSFAIWRQAMRPVGGRGPGQRAEVVLAVGEILDELSCSLKGRLLLCIVCLEGAWLLLH